ncbi:MAG: D-alanine--D-alanine ligase [Bacteroidota bacterium]|nr:D-alanine--D-alanine ligase [Bacteroidota bacterium]
MKKNIAVVAGGNSGEYEISIKSGRVVIDHLPEDRYSAYVIIINDQDWYHSTADDQKVPVDQSDFTLDLPGAKISFDAVFIAIHGTPGEDGRLQVYFDKLGIPYTSCDMVTSAMTFNKYFCTCFVNTLDVLTARSILVRNAVDIKTEKILQVTGLPCFIKPNKGGSSVGISKVNHEDELLAAVKRAFEEDDEVIAEGFIAGREITCGVLMHKGEITALPITEIVSKNEFFDYEAKYEGKSEEITPAPIPEEIAKKCQELSVFLFKEMECKGVVRFDYIFNDAGIYFLEVNTVPGLTEGSIIPQQAMEAGITLSDLFSDMIEQAVGG